MKFDKNVKQETKVNTAQRHSAKREKLVHFIFYYTEIQKNFVYDSFSFRKVFQACSGSFFFSFFCIFLKRKIVKEETSKHVPYQ